jgi:hypothetical protein
VKRKQAIILSVALVAFATGAMAAHIILLPRYAERKLVQRASRQGINLDTGKVSMLGTWLRFSDVVACSGDCGSDDPLVLKIGMLRVKPDLASLLRGRTEASVIDVSLLQARVDLTRPGPLLALMKRAVGAGGSGEGGSSERAVGSRIPEIRGDGMDLEVIVSDGVHATFSGARVMPGDEDGLLALDLGTTTFSGFGLEMDARHVVLDVDPSAGSHLVRGVNLVSPSITIEEGLVQRLVRQEETGADSAGGEGQLQTVSETSISDLSVQDVLSRLPVPVVEFSGARIEVPADGARAGLEMSRLKGSVALESDGSIVCHATGEAYQGPISVEIRARPEEITFEADTPYMPASVLDGLVDPPQGVRIEAARFMVDGSGTLDREADHLVFDGTLGGTGITVDSKKVALEPVLDVHFLLDGHLEMDRKSDTITVSESRIEASGIPVDVSSASLTKLDEGYQIAARGKIPHTHCQELFNSLPFEMRSSLPGLIFEGELGMDFDVQMDWQNPDDAVLDFSVDNRCKVVSEGSLKLDKFGTTFVHHVKDKVGEHDFVMGPGSASWVNLEEVAEHMPHAIVTTEDGAFYKHKGISVFAIKRAAIKNVKKGYFAFGASTITMQLVKNLFLSRDRTISRKLQEMIITWWVENSMDKDQIIELYLNVVEFGPAIYGIRNASLHYFDKEPSELSLLECAYLAKMLPNPVGRYRYYKNGGIDEKWRAVLERVVTKMFTRNYITEEEWKDAMEDDFAFYYPPTSDLIETNPYEEAPAVTSPFPDFSAE